MQEIFPYLLVALVPGLVLAIKTYAPRVPKPLWPIAAAVLGVALQAGNAWLAGADLNPFAGAVLGMAGVGLREIYDQLVNG